MFCVLYILIYLILTMLLQRYLLFSAVDPGKHFMGDGFIVFIPNLHPIQLPWTQRASFRTHHDHGLLLQIKLGHNSMIVIEVRLLYFVKVFKFLFLSCNNKIQRKMSLYYINNFIKVFFRNLQTCSRKKLKLFIHALYNSLMIIVC